MIYLFDIDGTLTLPRQPISKEFEEYFYWWMLRRKVFFVTGSDKQKIKEQLSFRIIDAASGIFSSMANELHIGEKLVYSNKLHIPDRLLPWLEQQVEYTEYPDKTGNHIEHRPGMINFSVVGRNATKQQRDAYQLWDAKIGERKRIATYINRKFPDLEACLGGQISLDIQEKGKNKSQASKWIRKNIGSRMHFFGDRCQPGGNDYDIVRDITEVGDGVWTQVFEPEHLMRTLKVIE